MVHLRHVIPLAFFTCISCDKNTLEFKLEEPTAIVVDASNNKPIEGAHILAEWRMEGGFGMHARGLPSLYIATSTTNTEGIFAVEVPSGTIRYRTDAYKPRMKHSEPTILVFKVGYDYEIISGTSLPTYLTDPKNSTIELKPNGIVTPDDIGHWYRVDHIEGFLSSLVINCKVDMFPSFYTHLKDYIDHQKRLAHQPLEPQTWTCKDNTYEYY